MRIVYLAAGAAGMYCGSCLHDNTLAAAMLKAGHDMLLVPAYTPLRTDEPDVSERMVFFGALNVYLQQKWAFFRHTPWLFDAILNRRWLLGALGRFGQSVEAERLGDLTVSMLSGAEGNQRKELDKLIRFLRDEARPQVVHLSNALLLGAAEEIRRLNVPLVCTLSGEDLFLRKLPAADEARARAAMQRSARHVDAFVALNAYYADVMAEYLDVSRERIHVIPHGLSLAGHAAATARDEENEEGVRIGFLARICHDKGLHLLVEACEPLVHDAELPPVHIEAAGYLPAAEQGYLEQIVARTGRWREKDRFHYHGEVTREEKIAFLQSLDVMSLPTVYRESKGISAIEAMANAVPVVLPAHGAFPELIEWTGGGLLFEPLNVRELTAALRRLILDRQLARKLGKMGRQAVTERFADVAMAERTVALYGTLGVSGSGAGGRAQGVFQQGP